MISDLMNSFDPKKSLYERKRFFIECDCTSPEHLLVFDFDNEFKYVDVCFMSSWHQSLLKRIKQAIRYILFKEPYEVCNDVGIRYENIEPLYSVLSEIKNGMEPSKKGVWISTKSEKLPAIDEQVLWLHACGGIIHDSIDKDWDDAFLKQFLAGDKITGPIVAWMRPIEFYEKQVVQNDNN